jgi:hypothetical protein
MPWQLDNYPEERRIVIKATGSLTRRDSQEQAQQVMDLAGSSQPARVLYDLADTTPRVPFPDLYALPKYYHKLEHDCPHRVAMVLPGKRANPSAWHAYETLCRRWGFQVKLSDNRQAAADWLAVDG